jgi:hypothetical protein
MVTRCVCMNPQNKKSAEQPANTAQPKSDKSAGKKLSPMDNRTLPCMFIGWEI